MGLIRSSFTVMVGMGCGVYAARNYNVPNVKEAIQYKVKHS